jgi:hypothetical protein
MNKNEDRALAIIRGDALVAAQKAGVSVEFFMVRMNYQALVPKLRMLMRPGAECRCGRRFLGEQDIQLMCILSPRHRRDWARLHGVNFEFYCGTCIRSRGSKPYETWLHEEWEAQQAKWEEVGKR